MLLLIFLFFGLCISASPIWDKTQTNLPTPLSSFVAASYENNIYLIGGVIDQFGQSPNDRIYRLNTTKNSDFIQIDSTSSWQSFSPSIPGTICCFDTQHKDALTIYSQGYSQSSNLLFISPFVSLGKDNPTVLMIFDFEQNSFRSPSEYSYSLKASVGDPCIVATDEFVYFMGGVQYFPPSRVEWKHTFQIYDISQDEWFEDDSSLVIGRRAAACNILDERIYVFGGRNVADSLDSIERYKLNNDDNDSDDGWHILAETVLQKKDEELR